MHTRTLLIASDNIAMNNYPITLASLFALILKYFLSQSWIE